MQNSISHLHCRLASEHGAVTQPVIVSHLLLPSSLCAANDSLILLLVSVKVSVPNKTTKINQHLKKMLAGIGHVVWGMGLGSVPERRVNKTVLASRLLGCTPTINYRPDYHASRTHAQVSAAIQEPRLSLCECHKEQRKILTRFICSNESSISYSSLVM